MSLTGMPLATRCRVLGVRTDNPLSYRLMEMGVIAGTELEIVRRAPLGDPLQIRLGDYDLTLRCTEADLIDVDLA
jgi:ferrous iron transport protein A